MANPIIQTPNPENTRASGITVTSHTTKPTWLSLNPQPHTVPYKVSEALKVTGVEYFEVLGFNDDNELIKATFDSTDADAIVHPVGFAGSSLPANTTQDTLTVYIEAHVVTDMLVWDDSWTDDAKEFAFNNANTLANTNIILGEAAKRMVQT